VKIIIGLLMGLSMCLFAVPAQAASFGLSPAMVDFQIVKGSSKTMEFTVVGYSGSVEISAEDMPVSVSPASVSAVAGSKITLTIKCNEDATDGLYDGRIVFLAKSGNSVMSGIKVRCNLTVGNSSSPASYGGGGGSSGVVSLPSPVLPPISVSPSAVDSGGSGSTVKTEIVIPNGNEGQKENNNIVSSSASFNFATFGFVIFSGLLLVGAFIIGYRWMRQKNFLR
jgi:hypothetical protein